MGENIRSSAWPHSLFRAIACLAVLTGGLVIAVPCRAGATSSYSDEEQRFLLDLARKAIVQYVGEGKTLTVEEEKVPEPLRSHRGCFVTLQKGREKALRGCIGSLSPVEALYRGVIRNAIKAATSDPRFPRVKMAELDDVTIEISVLTVPEELQFNNGKELLEKLRPTVDGVILSYRRCRATYLPQVWDQIKAPGDFLSYLCRKGGCPTDCWNRKGVQIQTYQAEHFSESEGEAKPAP